MIALVREGQKRLTLYINEVELPIEQESDSLCKYVTFYNMNMKFDEEH